MPKSSINSNSMVSTHSRPKAAGGYKLLTGLGQKVSTHSRSKAAGTVAPKSQPRHQRFNTQPPEGGWLTLLLSNWLPSKFQHTAARRRLAFPAHLPQACSLFQHTAARRRLGRFIFRRVMWTLFQHTAARRRLGLFMLRIITGLVVSTHSRPKAAG